MSMGALFMMVIGIIVLWGGFFASVLNAVKKSKS
ncbi:MetS family NSS transporter small subunit [Bacillus solimangrovi]|nr:MetS family NSS transporter small subunit [Bacillus solimangrovi]